MNLYNFNDDPDLEFEYIFRGRPLANKKSRWDTQDGKLLTDIILECQKREEIQGLLDDLLSDKEWHTLARKVCTAWLLYTGMPYEGVTAHTGMSPSSIARISKKLVMRENSLHTAISNVNYKRKRGIKIGL